MLVAGSWSLVVGSWWLEVAGLGLLFDGPKCVCLSLCLPCLFYFTFAYFLACFNYTAALSLHFSSCLRLTCTDGRSTASAAGEMVAGKGGGKDGGGWRSYSFAHRMVFPALLGAVVVRCLVIASATTHTAEDHCLHHYECSGNCRCTRKNRIELPLIDAY